MTTAQAASAPSSPPPSLPPSKTSKRCTKCKQTRKLEEFYNDSTKPDGKGSTCKGCKDTALADQRRRSKLAETLAAEIEALKDEKSSEELVDAYWEAGFDEVAIAEKVNGWTPNKVIEHVAVERVKGLTPEFREVERQKALIFLDRVYQQAMAKGDLKEARLTLADRLKAIGVIQQGGAAMNVTFQQNNILESRLEEWMSRNQLDGEIVHKEAKVLPPSSDTKG